VGGQQPRMRYLLDTTLLIDYVNGHPAATRLLAELFSETSELYTCDVVTCEALSGGDEAERRELGLLLNALEYVEIDPAGARRAAESRREGRSGRQRRSLADALIAAAAWRLDAALVTRNPRDFRDQGIEVREYG
jgi:predicted nucleic acid-binding protein